MARLLQYNVNAPTDWEGKLGYPKRGLQLEGGGVDGFRHSVSGHSLNWTHVAQTAPLAELHDRFGSMSIDVIESSLPLEERQRLNAARP